MACYHVLSSTSFIVHNHSTLISRCLLAETAKNDFNGLRSFFSFVFFLTTLWYIHCCHFRSPPFVLESRDRPWHIKSLEIWAASILQVRWPLYLLERSELMNYICTSLESLLNPFSLKIWTLSMAERALYIHPAPHFLVWNCLLLKLSRPILVTSSLVKEYARSGAG